MRVYIAVLVLIFSFQSWTKADDIKDFEIEGMSIGDSALDFFSLSHIKSNSWDDYSGGKYIRVQNDELSFFKTYDAVDFHYKADDKNYIIQNISGVIFYDNNIKDCYSKMDSIIVEISKNLNYISKSSKQTSEFSEDKKSKWTDVSFKLKSGYIYVTCYDYSKESGGQDNLKVSLDNEEINQWFVSLN